ncbi:MAG: hypothetical protein JWM44_2680 [Bacilli bacterium]|nr:hypothetical protein [Bacilli bacterium]
MIENQIKEIALNEILTPTFELTRQYLKVNPLVFIDGNPMIEDIVIDFESKTAEVYFPILDEEFYFVIYLDIEPEISIRIMNMSAGSRVYFSISSKTLNYEEIVKDFTFQPTRSWKKGELIPRRNIEKYYEASGFMFEPNSKKTGEVEKKVKYLLQLLHPFQNEMNKFEDDTIFEIQVCYYGYKEQMWGIHLEKDILKRLCELNLSLDIDLYASGADLDHS